MMKRGIVAAVFAAMLMVQVPSTAFATQQERNHDEQRDGHSRNEQMALRVLPLLLTNNVQARIAIMVLMMQSYSYQIVMSQGINVSSQNRVNVGGLLGNIFGKVYTAEDFLKSREIGSVYYARGSDTAAVVLKDNEKLEDYRVILFNGENQYDITGRPELRQLTQQDLAALSTISVFAQLMSYQLDRATVNALAEVEATGDMSGPLAQQYQADIPLLRQHLIGKVYRGADNTLLIVIPPAIVLER